MQREPSKLDKQAAPLEDMYTPIDPPFPSIASYHIAAKSSNTPNAQQKNDP